MQREIKFQFFIHSEGRMIDSIGFCFESATHIRIWYKKSDAIYNESFNVSNVSQREFIGLKDKNGKEIYEGDIIYNDDQFSCICGDDSQPDKRIIIWKDEDCKFDFEFFDNKMKGYGCSGFSLFKQNAETIFEIIGNIYEQPKLIKS